MRNLLLALPLTLCMGCVSNSTYDRVPLPPGVAKGHCNSVSFFRGEVHQMNECFLVFDRLDLNVDYRLFDEEEIPPGK